jgi:hypothetical protein
VKNLLQASNLVGWFAGQLFYLINPVYLLPPVSAFYPRLTLLYPSQYTFCRIHRDFLLHSTRRHEGDVRGNRL